MQRGVRPTSSRVREALFSIVGQDLADVSVLDAFGGSGLLSFEAASRGAQVTTAERQRAAAQAIRENASYLGVTLDLRVTDVRGVFSSGSWDVVLMDPPYGDDPWSNGSLRRHQPWSSSGHRASERGRHASRGGGLNLERSKRYGNTTLTVYGDGRTVSTKRV